MEEVVFTVDINLKQPQRFDVQEATKMVDRYELEASNAVVRSELEAPVPEADLPPESPTTDDVGGWETFKNRILSPHR